MKRTRKIIPILLTAILFCGSSFAFGNNNKENVSEKRQLIRISNRTPETIRIVSERCNESSKVQKGDRRYNLLAGKTAEFATTGRIAKTSSNGAVYYIIDMEQQRNGQNYKWSVGVFADQDAWKFPIKFETLRNNIRASISKTLQKINFDRPLKLSEAEKRIRGGAEFDLQQFVTSPLVPGYTWKAKIINFDPVIENKWKGNTRFGGSAHIEIIDPFHKEMPQHHGCL